MATIKVKMRASAGAMKAGVLVFYVYHERRVRQVTTGYRLYPHEWDNLASEVICPEAVEPARRTYLTEVSNRLLHDVARFDQVVMRLERIGRPYTADQVVAEYRHRACTVGLVAFGRSLVAELQRIGRDRTAERYATVLNSMERFLTAGEDVPLDGVDAALMAAYERYLKGCGLCSNSTSYYMRNLRAIYNRAVDRGLTVQRNPFKHVYTGIGKTVKRAVPLQVMRQIKYMDLSTSPGLDYARDLFLFSFYTRGMSFIDMAFLKKTDLQDGVLAYRRQKTGQQLFVKWEEPMQEILDKYDTCGTPYLLPIIRNAGGDARRQYRKAAHLVNEKLKLLGRQLGLTMPLTMYVARHGWASIAKSQCVPVSTISEAMGHDSEVTTRIYLASLDTSCIDDANKLIIKLL